MDATFIQGRITFFETLIPILEAAIEAVATGTVQSYTINTGQTTETVNKKNLMSYTSRLDWAYGRLEFWTMRLNGGATIQIRPGY